VSQQVLSRVNTLIHASSLFRHWSIVSNTIARCAEIQPMSQQAAAATRPYRGLVLDTPAPPVACPRRVSRAMQIIGSTKLQKVNSFNLFSFKITKITWSRLCINNTVENDFSGNSKGKVATADRWGGQTCKKFVSNFSHDLKYQKLLKSANF